MAIKLKCESDSHLPQHSYLLLYLLDWSSLTPSCCQESQISWGIVQKPRKVNPCTPIKPYSVSDLKLASFRCWLGGISLPAHVLAHRTQKIPIKKRPTSRMWFKVLIFISFDGPLVGKLVMRKRRRESIDNLTKEREFFVFIDNGRYSIRSPFGSR